MRHSSVFFLLLHFQQTRFNQGFTLIEVQVVLLIAMLLLGIAMPSLRYFLIEIRLANDVNQLVATALLARTEALKRGRLVLICRSTTARAAVACTDNANRERGQEDWSSGWIVKMAGDEHILHHQAALSTGTSVIGQSRVISYDALGGPGNSFTKLVFRYQGQFERVVCFSRSGRIKVVTGTSECG